MIGSLGRTLHFDWSLRVWDDDDSQRLPLTGWNGYMDQAWRKENARDGTSIRFFPKCKMLSCVAAASVPVNVALVCCLHARVCMRVHSFHLQHAHLCEQKFHRCL